MADATTPKPPAPSRLEPGTLFIKNPGGVVNDMMEPHPGIDSAKRGDAGWRFASADEIRDYCKLHNIETPDSAAYNAQLKNLRKEPEPEAAIPPAPSAEEAGLEPVEPATKASKK